VTASDDLIWITEFAEDSRGGHSFSWGSNGQSYGQSSKGSSSGRSSPAGGAAGG